MKKLWKNIIVFMMIFALVGTSPIFAMAEDAQTTPDAPTLVSTKDATVTASYSMFKVAESAKVNTYSDGSMTAEILYTGSSFLKMYLGTAEEAAAASEGFYEAAATDVEKEYLYTIPVTKLGEAFNAAVQSSKGNWKDNTLTVTLVEDPMPTPTPTLVSTKEATVTASYSMFKVAESAKVNTYSDGSMTAEILYTGSSFLKMYLGTAEEAAVASEGIYEAAATDVEKEYLYTIPLTKLGEAFDAAVLSSKGNWKDNTLTVSLVQEQDPTPDPTPTPDPAPTPDPTPTPDTSIPSDGAYTIDVSSSASMFKVVACKLTVKEQKMTAVITLSGTGYDYLYMGTAEAATAAGGTGWITYKTDAEGKYTYEIPVEALDKGIAVAAHSQKNDKWYDRTLTFHSATLQEYKFVPSDGVYTIDVSSSASMFKVVACKLTVKEQTMTAVITLSGTGYDYLYMGTAEAAAATGGTGWITYKTDAEGKYTYEIPVEALDKGIAVAAHSQKNDKWFDRTLTLYSATLQAVSGENGDSTGDNNENNNTGNSTENNNGNNNTENNEQTNNGVTSEEDIKDMIENVKPGEVADGTYTPSFGYKGGTGRVTLSCNKVVVKDGKATATIVFSSPNYTYAKVNGTKYYNLNKGGNSTFEIPVNLNSTTNIAAETTAMGSPYEIEYVLYIYVDGTNVSNIKSEVTYDDKEEAEEEEQEEIEIEEETVAVEENSWGAFNSEQQTSEETIEEETGAAEEEATEETKDSGMTPKKVAVAAAVGVGVVGVGGVAIAIGTGAIGTGAAGAAGAAGTGVTGAGAGASGKKGIMNFIKNIFKRVK